jgi:hypothetical protein
MANKWSIVKSCLIGAVPVVALLVAAPVRPAFAQFGDIFGAITGTETAIGGLIGGVGQCVNAMYTLRQTVLAPVGELTAIQNGVLNTTNAYRNWMAGVFGVSISSGQTPGVITLDANLFQGSTLGAGGGTSSISMATPFATVYGTLPTSNKANANSVQQIDMTDSLARDAMVQGVDADASATAMINLGHSLEDQVATTSPGSAPQIEAQGLAASLQSLAVEHKLYAAELRTMSAQLALDGSAAKSRATVNLNATNGLNLLMQRNY